MEIATEAPTGTKLRFDVDREFEHPTGDSVMRVQGTSDAGRVFDATYVELNDQEATLIGMLLRQSTTPPPWMKDWIAQEVQAAFSSRLSARDAAQIAEIVTRSQWRALVQELGAGNEFHSERMVRALAERFERTASKRRTPYLGGGNGGEGSYEDEGAKASPPTRGSSRSE